MLDNILAVVTDLTIQQEEVSRLRKDNPTKSKSFREVFRLTDTHVEIASIATNSSESEATWERVCKRLEVTADTRDSNGRNWGRELTFADRDTRQKKLSIPMRMLAGDGQEVRALLLDNGLEIEPNRKAKYALLSYIQGAAPSRKLECVDRIGWHHQGSVFVMPDMTIGSDDVVLQSDTALDHAFGTSGTLEQWKQHVAAPCEHNSRLMLGISFAFTGPLLELVGLEGGGIHFFGNSSTGKTTILSVAASVWGGGDGPGGFVRTWRATANGLEGVAAMHNDTLLCLDELGQIDPKEASEAAYLLANGQGKSRASRSGSARKVARWRIPFLSTGEITLADRLTEINDRHLIKAGQEVRILNVPAEVGGANGCFEELGGFADGAKFADELKRASRRYYGVAAVAFIERLVAEDLTLFRGQLRELIDDFSADAANMDLDGQVKRATNRFALAAVAGELAVHWGILPWQPGSARAAAQKCLRDWIRNRGGVESSEELTLLRRVRSFFESHGESRFSLMKYTGESPALNEAVTNQKSTINRVGFRSEESDGVHYYVFKEAMRNEICRGFDLKRAAKILIKAGHLVPGEKDKSAVKKRIPGHKNSVRMYHFLPAVLGGALRGEDEG